MEAPTAGAGGGGTAVWVRRSLLLSALAQSTAGAGNSFGGNNNKLSKISSSGKIASSGSAEEDRASDFTALTANSSTASSASTPNAAAISTSWGWVRARLQAENSATGEEGVGESGGGVVVKVSDGDHPDLDGRSVSIPSGLLNTIPSATASTSSTSSNKSKSAGSNNGGEEGTVYGPDLVMANAAGEESPADLIQVSLNFSPPWSVVPNCPPGLIGIILPATPIICPFIPLF